MGNLLMYDAVIWKFGEYSIAPGGGSQQTAARVTVWEEIRR